VRLEGPRLTLTALDADGLAAARPTADMADALPFFLARLREDPGARGFWVWLATLEDGREVGLAGFGGRPGENRRLTLGYSVHDEHQGRGYATEMVELLTQWALAQDGVEVVRLTIRPENVPSLRVAKKAGFEPTGETVVDDEHGRLLVFEQRNGA
jgi:RimJ/RimL family protein N-acetyltransferase